MSQAKSLGSSLLLVALAIVAALGIGLIAMGSLPMGIALLAVPVALFPSAYRAFRSGAETEIQRSDDAR